MYRPLSEHYKIINELDKIERNIKNEDELKVFRKKKQRAADELMHDINEGHPDFLDTDPGKYAWMMVY